MRNLLAVAVVALVLATAGAPHLHEGPLGQHACAACLASTAEQARSETPDVAPAVVVERSPRPPRPGLAPAVGFPLGAVAGQSPPVA